MSKFLSVREFEARQKKDPVSVEGCYQVLTREEFEARYAKDPASVAGCFVTKEAFFALTSLREMTEPGAAEATYQRWLHSKRVAQVEELVEDPTGVTEDKLDIFLEARFVNAERRRANTSKRHIEESRKLAMQDLPAALR